MLLNLLLFAQGESLGPQTILEIVAGSLCGAGLFAAFVVVAAKGYWTTNVAPLIENEIRKWHHSPEQVAARSQERLSSFREWYDRREQLEEREKELQHLLRTPAVTEECTRAVRLIIDNEIKRSDGLISKEVKTQVHDMESRLFSKLEEMSEALREDNLFKQEMLRKMGKLEGAINTMLPNAQLGKDTLLPERGKR